MKELTFAEIDSMSFHDVRVLTFHVDLDNKKLSFVTDCSFVGEGIDNYVGRTEVIIKDWDSCEIRVGDGSGQNNWTYLDQKTIKGKELREICVSEIGRDQLLMGFNVGTGYWTEYKFINGKVEVKIEEEDPFAEQRK